MDPRLLNQVGWDRLARAGHHWTRPVTPVEVEHARRGDWSVVLTPNRAVPRAWFGDLDGRDVLCLASGGGQQGPILAAAGARVTVFDASAEQLAQGKAVAARDGLALWLVQGFMDDLSSFASASFDLVFHPASNCFAPVIEPVWRECFRVLRPGGALLAGFMNPDVYIFGSDTERDDALTVRFPLPSSDLRDLPRATLEALVARDHVVEFSHTLEAQIGGQLEAGFLLAGFYEDRDLGLTTSGRSRYMPTLFATRSIKPP